MAGENKGHWIITLKVLCELINDKRRQLKRTPIDHSVITTRLILKSNAAHPGRFNFEAPEIKLDEEAIAVLEGMLNDQFDLYMKNELVRHCTFQAEKSEEQTQPIPPPHQEPEPEPTQGGLKSTLKKLFGG